jgi:hypothetical protein
MRYSVEITIRMSPIETDSKERATEIAIKQINNGLNDRSQIIEYVAYELEDID